MAHAPDERVPVGYVRRAHGLDGAVLVRALADDVAARFKVGMRFLTDEAEPREFAVRSCSTHHDDLIVRFDALTNRNEAEALRGVTLTIAAADRRRLGEDEYWPDELVGCDAFDEAGERLGTVSAVELGGAQDRLVVTTVDGDLVEVPFVSALVPLVDRERGRITLSPPEGMFD